MNPRANLLHAAALLSAASLAFCAGGVALHASPPPNYDLVKQQLADSLGFDPPPTASQQAAEKSLQLSADQSIQALETLFGENTNGPYRTVIVGVLYSATKSQGEVATFLFDQVSASPEMKGVGSRFKGQTWIHSSLALLSRINAPKALSLARQGLASPNYTVQAMAIETLGKVGQQEDIARLQAYAAKSGTFPADDYVPDESKMTARESMQQIADRLAH